MQRTQPEEAESAPGVQATVRRVIEQTIAGLLLIAMSIPIALTACAVWWTLGTPLLFSQTRVGRNQRIFTIQKFRTMHDTRDEAGKLLPDNLRETRLTRFLRRIRVDEFPQLLAIARGEMSFFGPRPLLPATIQAMGELGHVRCHILPGLSGWAQVNGNSLLSDSQKLVLDIWYVDHKSASLDMLILMKTFMTLIRGERINEKHVRNAKAYAVRNYSWSAAAGAEIARP